MSDVPARSVPHPPARCDVLVIGAGIAGLVTAFRLRQLRPELNVQVVDVAQHAGGKLRTGELAGVTIDLGAEAVIARRPEGLALLEDLDLTSTIHHPGVADARITSGGRQFPVPTDTLMGVPTNLDSVAESGLLSSAGIARLGQATDQVLSGDGDISVGAAVGEAFGPEVVDRLVEPLLAGVYAGRADRLSLGATIPALRARLGAGGNVLSAARAARAAAPRSDGPVFATVSGGIGSIPQQIIERGQLSVTLGCPARRIDQDEHGFVIQTGAAPQPWDVRARAVVVAVPAPKAARLLGSVARDAAVQLAEVQTANVAVVAIAYRAADLVHPPPRGSGILVPASEGTAVKAATYVTNKWPHLTGDDDLFIVRASLGRIGDDQVLKHTDGDLLALARRDLAILAGISGAPVDWLVQRWAAGLPQYDVGHLDRVVRVRQAVARVPGLAVAGATYDGVGIPGCINSAHAAADQVLQHLQGDE